MNEYNPEAIKNLPYIKHGSIYFTEFGKIIEVNNGEEFVALRSEFGQEIYMRKWYWGWGKVFQWATMMCDQELPVIYETGSARDPSYRNTYFRDVIPQQIWRGSAFANIPDDAGEKARVELIMERIRNLQVSWERKLAEKELTGLKAEVEQLSLQEQGRIEKAKKALAKQWQHEIKRDTAMSVLVNGMAADTNAKYPKKTERSAAIRLEIDLTKQTRLNIVPVGLKQDTNKLKCKLPDFNNREAIVCLQQSTRKDQYGQWVAASFENTYHGWFNVENTKHYRGMKNRSQQPIEFYLDLHREIASKVLFPE